MEKIKEKIKLFQDKLNELEIISKDIENFTWSLKREYEIKSLTGGIEEIINGYISFNGYCNIKSTQDIINKLRDKVYIMNSSLNNSYPFFKLKQEIRLISNIVGSRGLASFGYNEDDSYYIKLFYHKNLFNPLYVISSNRPSEYFEVSAGNDREISNLNTIGKIYVDDRKYSSLEQNIFDKITGKKFLNNLIIFIQQLIVLDDKEAEKFIKTHLFTPTESTDIKYWKKITQEFIEKDFSMYLSNIPDLKKDDDIDIECIDETKLNIKTETIDMLKNNKRY